MMTVERDAKPFWSGWRKMGILAAIGGVFGFFVGGAVARSFKDGGSLEGIAGSEPALLVALLYVVIGVFVGVGSMFPKVGAATLNVEDADEVREQAELLRLSSVGTILFGVSLGAIAIGGEGGMLTAPVAALIGFLAFVAAMATSISSMRHADEFMREIMREAGAVSYYIAFIVLGGWAAAAHLGYAPTPSAIHLMAALWGAPLIASYWVIGRRGMMYPRS